MKKIKSALDKRVKTDLKKIRQADILIGIPSFNSIHSIGRVVQACILGLAKYFPQSRAVVFISEGGEARKVQEAIHALSIEDDLERSFIPAPSSQTHIVVTDYSGSPGKGSAIKAILEAARMLETKACSVVDSDLRSISPEWIELLIAPILLKGFGFVAPYYSRHKYDGTITNLIAYPMMRALYGRRVRQPIGGDFGFSPELAESLLSKDVWETDIARFGIDIWMTTIATEENHKICQSFLGAKIHDEKDPGKDLAPMFYQVVGTLFTLMEMYGRSWVQISGSRPTAIFGFETEVNPKPVTVDVENLIHSFLSQVPTYQTFWQEILEQENYYKVLEVSEIRDRYFELPFEIWVKSVYDFALAFHKRPEDRNTILEALIPLYFAAVASFVEKTKTMDSRQVEELITDQCLIFEELKPYLVHRWEKAQK
jgi:glycosyltransferase involved in cell wall biosynthesis